MKKVCTRCNSPLNIAERQCASCGAFNPFYLASYRSPQPVNVEIEALEQQLLATEIKAQHDAAQPAFEKADTQGTLRETTETGLKEEIQRVKSETESYKQQTIEMVKEVRGELQQIEEENKRLKQEVETLSKSRIAQPAQHPELMPAQPSQKTEKRFFAALSIFVIGIFIGLGYFFTVHRTDDQPTGIKNTAAAKPLQNQEKVVMPASSNTVVQKDSTPVKKLLAVATPTSPVKPVVMATDAPKENVKTAPLINEAKIKGDLPGNKLSGCGITINNPGEIASFSNLALIAKEPTGEAKYKFAARIVQGGEMYYATPYVYYDANGVFLRIDGTNCE